MADTYKEALARRATLKSELAMLDQFIELHSKLFGARQESLSLPGTADKGEDAERRNDPKAIADAAGDALARAERPMQRGKLIEAVEKAGIEIHSGDKNKYIGTVMWRNRNRFMNIEGQGYWPRNRAVPPDIQAELLS